MISKERKFTIIIPTRDRADTLLYTLASAISQNYPNLEIIVSDNASQDVTHEVVKSFCDSRIKYINTGHRVSMSHNWEFALSHVDEGWITVLGDDDAIIPGAISQVNQIIDATGTKAVRSNGCGYMWPTMTSNCHGHLHLSTKKGYKKVGSEKALSRVMSGNLYYTNLPVLYNGGFVDISLVKEAKAITDSFFLSMTPDVYAGIVFSLLTDEYVYSHEPLAINGASHHSGGTAAFEAVKRNRSYNPAEKFFSEENIPFHPSLPLTKEGRPVKSIQATVYEAYLQAAVFHERKRIVYNLVSPKQQLEIILRDCTPVTKPEVMSWSSEFAEKNNIIADQSLNLIAGKKSVLFLLKKITVKIVNLCLSLSLSGRQVVGLDNVYEASILVALIKRGYLASFQLAFSNLMCRAASIRELDFRRKLMQYFFG